MKYVYDANLGFLFNDTVDYKVVPDRIFVVALEPKQGVSAERMRRWHLLQVGIAFFHTVGKIRGGLRIPEFVCDVPEDAE